ncbi:MAG: thiol:disulfide interchange protein DsbA/DsbL [Rhodocyclaceae bacterium]|nr:thiol:disulfide interchange protein DsbA/DsbL [Rhodocyclaceae bacterium]
MNKLKALIGIACLVFATLAGAQELREGRDYTVLNPAQATEAKGKIEVTEFFWYGCSHCFDFEPLLQKWLKTMPKDVVFRRVPALFPGGKWLTDTKTYYTLEAMGLVEKMHQEVFDATHIDRTRLNDEATLFAWMEKKGVDRKKFEDTFRSFAIQSKAQRSMQLSQAHGLDGVPALVVQGKYKPAAGATGSYGDVLVTLDKLIAKVRAEQGKK